MQSLTKKLHGLILFSEEKIRRLDIAINKIHTIGFSFDENFVQHKCPANKKSDRLFVFEYVL